MEIASTWHWKVSAALVPISFLVCRLVALATEHVVAPANPGDLAPVIIQQFIHVFANLLQYVLPMIFVVAASISFFKRSRSTELFDRVRSDAKADISAMSWQAFETLVAEGFRHRGFEVMERGGAGPDGGVDLAVARGHERFLVQCKQWRAQQVGVSVVRELYGVMAAEHVAGGYVVTSGSFTKDAKKFSAGRNIELIDGKGLWALLRDGQATVRPIESMPATPRAAPRPPSCPKCQSPMVLRTAKRGAHVGRSFWGCPQYPKCQAIVARQ